MTGIRRVRREQSGHRLRLVLFFAGRLAEAKSRAGLSAAALSAPFGLKPADWLDPDGFAQVLRARAVNLRHVLRIEGDLLDRRAVISRDRAERLPLSRSFAVRFRAM